jgi:accessory gene regulator protein AgrB
MKKYIRLSLAVLILSISIALLIWGYAPNPRETRIQSIVPTEMQLPAP